MIVRRDQHQQNRRGFTLMEMLVVVAIIVVLAGAGGYYFWQSYSDSKVDLAVAHMKGTLQQAVEAYQLHHGTYPNDLSILLNRTNGKGPYLKKADALLDPWGQQYQITGPPQNQVVPKIYTVAPDGSEISNYTGSAGFQQTTNR